MEVDVVGDDVGGGLLCADKCCGWISAKGRARITISSAVQKLRRSFRTGKQIASETDINHLMDLCN